MSSLKRKRGEGTVVGIAFLGETLARQIARKSNMLRITVTESASEQRWILQGRLTGSSIEELTTNWCANRSCLTSQNCIVDLNEVTTIDKDGEQLLLMMIRDGAKLVATGLYTKHLLESLSAQISVRPDPN